MSAVKLIISSTAAGSYSRTEVCYGREAALLQKQRCWRVPWYLQREKYRTLISEKYGSSVLCRGPRSGLPQLAIKQICSQPLFISFSSLPTFSNFWSGYSANQIHYLYWDYCKPLWCNTFHWIVTYSSDHCVGLLKQLNLSHWEASRFYPSRPLMCKI